MPPTAAPTSLGRLLPLVIALGMVLAVTLVHASGATTQPRRTTAVQVEAGDDVGGAQLVSATVRRAAVDAAPRRPAVVAAAPVPPWTPGQRQLGTLALALLGVAASALVTLVAVVRPRR